MNHRTAKIHDLGLAAALVTYGHELLEAERDMSGRTYFVFSQTHEVAKVIRHYWSDTLNVHARKFFDNTKMLKSLIYSER